MNDASLSELILPPTLSTAIPKLGRNAFWNTRLDSFESVNFSGLDCDTITDSNTLQVFDFDCVTSAPTSSPTAPPTEPAPYIYTSDTTCTWDTNPNLDISMPDLLNVGCCGMAKKIIIDSSVIVIDDRAFMACLDVEEIDFSGATSLTTINRAAFHGMTNLGRVDMGVSVRRYRISSVLF